MKTNLQTIAALFLVLAPLSAFAAPDVTIQGDNDAINSACSTDAQAASCGKEVVGQGLLKCLHAYKKANPKYKFSPGCKVAMKQRRSDEKAGK